MKHLSDENLQAFLDKSVSPDEVNEISSHLQQCQECCHQLSLYSLLYRNLSQDPKFEMSYDFAEKVLSALENKKAAFLQEKLMTLFFLSFGLIAVLVTSSYFVDFGTIWKDMQFSIPSLDMNQNLQWVNLIKSFLPEIAPALVPVILIGSVLLLLTAVDRFVLRQRFRAAER